MTGELELVYGTVSRNRSTRVILNPSDEITSVKAFLLKSQGRKVSASTCAARQPTASSRVNVVGISNVSDGQIFMLTAHFHCMAHTLAAPGSGNARST